MKPISRFDATQFPTTFAAQIEDFDIEGCVYDAPIVSPPGLACVRDASVSSGRTEQEMDLHEHIVMQHSLVTTSMVIGLAVDSHPCCMHARRLVDKKNARRYDDCLLYSMVSAKKVGPLEGSECAADTCATRLHHVHVSSANCMD